MILLDLSHTSHTRARTGIQRVCRSLHTALANRNDPAVRPITWDPYAHEWRGLKSAEFDFLQDNAAATQRHARWPWTLRVRGQLGRWLKRPSSPLLGATGLIVPEIFSATVAAALPALRSNVNGPSVAVFHDAIALRLPELTPSKTIGRFPAYLRELLGFDGIAAVSEDSRSALVEWWRWVGVVNTPPVITLSLGIDRPQKDTALARTTTAPVVLSVGTLEARKNHLALLEACERLWKQGRAFELRLIGLAHAQTGRAAVTRVRALQAAGRPLRYDGAVGDDALRSAYHECAFTVYPSLMEGFGLPVLESLSYGKPCICSARGALAESAREGGCLSLPSVDESSLADAIDLLLSDPSRRATLAAVALERKLKSWDEYAREITAWMKDLRPKGARKQGIDTELRS